MKITLSVDNNLDLGYQVGIGYQEYENNAVKWHTAVTASTESRSDVADALARLAYQISEREDVQTRSQAILKSHNASVKTLRDDFAISIIQGMISFSGYSTRIDHLAAMAYEMADSMLAERAK